MRSSEATFALLHKLPKTAALAFSNVPIAPKGPPEHKHHRYTTTFDTWFVFYWCNHVVHECKKEVNKSSPVPRRHASFNILNKKWTFARKTTHTCHGHACLYGAWAAANNKEHIVEVIHHPSCLICWLHIDNSMSIECPCHWINDKFDSAFIWCIWRICVPKLIILTKDAWRLWAWCMHIPEAYASSLNTYIMTTREGELWGKGMARVEYISPLTTCYLERLNSQTLSSTL